MSTRIAATVSFTVPDRALREGEDTFKAELKDNLEFWFELPVAVTVSVETVADEASGESTAVADVELDFTVPDEADLDLGDDTVEDVLRSDLESFFEVPVITTIGRRKDD